MRGGGGKNIHYKKFEVGNPQSEGGELPRLLSIL
jgi:hypothetical protein